MIHGTVVADFFVDGKPVPQGSKRHVGNGRMIEASKGHAAWRKRVSDHARTVYAGEVVTGPILLRLSFVMPRPVSTPKRSTPPAVKRPDLDKLCRLIGDALTSTIWKDDSQVVKMDAAKRIAEIGEPSGVHISVVRLADSATVGPMAEAA